MNSRARSPQSPPCFTTHRACHEAVLGNECWFSNGRPLLGRRFTMEKATKRKIEVIDLLFKSGRRERRNGDAGIASQLETLADKLFYCHAGRRCGSLACTECHRAFQKAKVAGQSTAIKQLAVKRREKLLVMANVIPLKIAYTPKELSTMNVRNLNRRLKDALAKASFDRVMLGSIDFSWEDGFYQPHWHIAMFTSDPKKLRERLKLMFPGQSRGDRPVVVSQTYDLNFLPYKDKAIKLPALLRNNRRHLSDLLLALDRTEPLELMVLCRMRVSAQDGGLNFKEIAPR